MRTLDAKNICTGEQDSLLVPKDLKSHRSISDFLDSETVQDDELGHKSNDGAVNVARRNGSAVNDARRQTQIGGAMNTVSSTTNSAPDDDDEEIL